MIEILKAKKISSRFSVFMAANNVDFALNIDNNSCKTLKKEQGIEKLITLKQVHGADIVTVNEQTPCDIEADGLFSSISNISIGILTADCYPVVITGTDHIAALHCGWKGTIGGLVKNAVSLFDAANDIPTYAFIGAGISQENFEVKSDFIDHINNFIDSDKYIMKKEEKYYFDIKAVIKDQLTSFHITNIECLDICTFATKQMHSYRRDGALSGRMITVAQKLH